MPRDPQPSTLNPKPYTPNPNPKPWTLNPGPRTVKVKTKAVFKTGASLNGRILAQTACTLDQATITQP